MSEDDRCGFCNHERYMHLNHRGEPRTCAAKDLGEQCAGFVEPERTFSLAEIGTVFAATFGRPWREFHAALVGKAE